MKIIKEELSENLGQSEYDMAQAMDTPEGEAMFAAQARLQELIDGGADIHTAVATLENEIPPNLIQYALSTVVMPSGRMASAEVGTPSAGYPEGEIEGAPTLPGELEEIEDKPPVPYQGADYFRKKRKEQERTKQDIPGDALTPAEEPKLKPSGKMSARHRFKHSGSGRSMKRIKETKNMKITQEQLKRMAEEELKKLLFEEMPEDPDGDGVQGTGFPADVPFVDYEDAKNDSDGRYEWKPIGTLPRLWKENGNKPVFFMTKIRDQDYPSVYTRYKPNSKDAWHYHNMGVKLVWADSRYGIGNWDPKSIVKINKHTKKLRSQSQWDGSGWNYNIPEE